ncbi:MAG TPA: hypothetical protein VGF10_12100 [Gaiella sp.]
MKRLSGLAVASGALVLALPGLGQAGSVHLEQYVASGSSVQVGVVVRKHASFSVLLRTRTVGRTQLRLLGAHAPKGGPLIDTSTTACEGAAGSWYCKASYEPLPPGTYVFRVVRRSGFGTNIELTVRW